MTEREAIVKLFGALEVVTAWADRGIPSDGMSNSELAEADAAITRAHGVISEVAQQFNFPLPRED